MAPTPARPHRQTDRKTDKHSLLSQTSGHFLLASLILFCSRLRVFPSVIVRGRVGAPAQAHRHMTPTNPAVRRAEVQCFRSSTEKTAGAGVQMQASARDQRKLASAACVPAGACIASVRRQRLRMFCRSPAAQRARWQHGHLILRAITPHTPAAFFVLVLLAHFGARSTYGSTQQ